MTANVDESSVWRVTVHTPNAGGPYTITVSAKNDIRLENVMIGDVWLCGGQSNMEHAPGATPAMPDVEAELKAADNYPDVRYFHVKHDTASIPKADCTGSWGWKASTASSSKWFTSVGQIFGRKLHDNLQVPIGLVGSHWGGTGAETWTPAALIENDPAALEASGKQTSNPAWFYPVKPGHAYNAMIHPLATMPIAGVIWYQGESNVKTYYTYRQVLTSLISGWRKAWGKDFPFYIVQISPYNDAIFAKDANVLLREIQETVSKEITNSGLVVISDIGIDVKDMHPRNKRPVGERLAALALARHYGLNRFEDELCPLYKNHITSGDKVEIFVENVGEGLKTATGGESKYFEIAGADRVFRPAHSEIARNRISVWSSDVPHPVAVRYGWGNTVIPDVVNEAGLPLGAFRTYRE
jgi:sialate O-acetylesterase